MNTELGTGTKVQHKMYLSGYYPTRDLNDGTENVCWPSHHENKTFEQYYGMFLARPSMDGYIGYDREQLRQTILNHENVFRQQLHELHRLYKRQTDMMNEVRSREPHEHVKLMGTPQSRFFAFQSVDGTNRWHDASLPLVDFSHHIPSTSCADSVQSYFSSMDLKVMQSGCGSTHNGLRSKEYESLESKCKKVQRRLFDLELPADECINNEEEGQGASGGSGVVSCPPKRNYEVAGKKNGNLFTHNGDASSSNMHLKRSVGFTDLNEPFQIEEPSSTASVDILGNVTCSREEIERIDLSTSCYSGFLPKETSQIPSKVKDEKVSLHNLRLESNKRQKEWSPHTFNSGKTTSNKSSLNGSFQCQYLPAICESSQVGNVKVHEPDQNRGEQSSMKTIFGVDLSEGKTDSPIMASDTCVLQPRVPLFNVANSESSCFSSRKKLQDSWRQTPTSIQGNPCFLTFPKSDNGSVTSMHGNEITLSLDGSLVNNNVKMVASLNAEPSYQNFPCLVSQLESKESQVCKRSVGVGYLNGISDSNSTSEQVPANNFKGSGSSGNSKSVEEPNAVLTKRCQNEAVSDLKLISVDGPKKEENPKVELSWLRDISFCNGKYSKEQDVSHQVNLDFLQNHSQQFVNKVETMKCPSQRLIQDSFLMSNSYAQVAEERRTGGGEPSSWKILRNAFFEKQISKDLPSASSAPKSSCGSKTNGTKCKSGLLLDDLNHDPMPSESGEIQHFQNLVAEEGSVDYSANVRNHIDLNVVVEEEAQLTHFSPRTNVKIVLEIDLEAPVVLYSEMDATSGGEFVESKLKEPSDSLQGGPEDFHEGFMKVAAEALIAISSTGMHNMQDDAIHHQVETSFSDSLQWFAEIVTSYQVDNETDVISVSVGKISTDLGDSILNGIDYFEYMTLNLTETKLERCHYLPLVIEDARDEDILPKRPRRVQARRGRQRKDFQRDVLPGLASLSRNDAAEDLQIIEGLVRATGGTWQSSLSKWNSPRAKGGRGRKRCASATSTLVTTFGPPQIQQLKSGELGLDETRLTGWGKRTRRPPRQRCLISHPPFPLQ